MWLTLALAREGKKMTHKQAAEALGISRSYYTQIENGLRRPSLTLARRIVEVFGLTYEQALERS